jgi:hypothetical protein
VDIAESRDLCKKLLSLIAQLPSEEKILVKAWMNSERGDRAIESVGGKLGMSRPAAYQSLQRVLSRLRRHFPELEVDQ